MPSQATRIQLALANGTLMDFTPESNPRLWKAVQVFFLTIYRASPQQAICCSIPDHHANLNQCTNK